MKRKHIILSKWFLLKCHKGPFTWQSLFATRLGERNCKAYKDWNSLQIPLWFLFVQLDKDKVNFWIWFSIPHCCLNHKLPHVRNTNTDHFLFEEKGGKDYRGASPMVMVLAFGKLVCLFHSYLPSHSRATLSPAFSKVSRIPQWKMRITFNTYLIYSSLIKVQYISLHFFCMSNEQQHLLNLHICSTVWNIGIEIQVIVCFIIFSLVAQSCSTFCNPIDCR